MPISARSAYRVIGLLCCCVELLCLPVKFPFTTADELNPSLGPSLAGRPATLLEDEVGTGISKQSDSYTSTFPSVSREGSLWCQDNLFDTQALCPSNSLRCAWEHGGR